MKTKTTPHLVVKDHLVSKEDFKLNFDETLQLFETFPQPSPQELPKYYQSENYISHTDSTKNLLERVYQLVRIYTTKRKVKLINAFAKTSQQLLDIGCGTGEFLKQAQKSSWEITGIEPNDQARGVANLKVNNSVFPESGLSKLNKASFDVITLWHVLEHLPNLDQYIETLSFLLKSKGTLIIAVPNFNSYDAKYYQSFWAAYDVPRHLWHFSQTSIKLLFEAKGFKLKQTLPMKFDAFYVSLLSEKYKNGKTNLFKAFWIGIRSNFKARETNEYSSLIYVLKKDKNQRVP